jgi:hypothetical protein
MDVLSFANTILFKAKHDIWTNTTLGYQDMDRKKLLNITVTLANDFMSI